MPRNKHPDPDLLKFFRNIALKHGPKNMSDLARNADVNIATLHSIMRGDTHGSLVVWQKVLDALDIELGYRIKDTPDE